jgi:NADP-dependent 3-hydroxy acid dehydrogenase YdfG
MRMPRCKAILITGAGAGIGAATATFFVQQGWKVGLYDRDEAAVQRLAAQLGTQAHAGRLDVTHHQDWEHALADFVTWAGQLDVLLNNAGILYSGGFEHIDLDDHQRLVQVNIQGLMNGCHSAFRYLKQAKRSRVINLSSASAIYGQSSLASYSASKFFVRGLTEALDGEWKAHGIRVMDIMPLFVQTAMVDGMNAGSVRKLGVHLTPDDVAQVIYKAATAPAWLAPVHWPVGLPAKALYHLVALTPDRINRAVNRWLGH